MKVQHTTSHSEHFRSLRSGSCLYLFSWICDVLPLQFRASASIPSSLRTASLLTVVSELLLLRWRFSYLTFPWHPRELMSWQGGS
jgi:hypothetical protein